MSRRSLQNIFRINVVPVQSKRYVNAFVAFNIHYSILNKFLQYHPDNCSEMHAPSHDSNEDIDITIK